ncbi:MULTISPECIES: signal recognition particle-docking protein FtsY [Parafrankia]|uniref:Signal recognition particle receptor FtsY n=1 Tax=Parafrankia soli TaxID=2599596 RepID=A0A1S1R4M4_9ACTN|nr:MULTISPECIES: signal recognition particle-docking protein FtsY [Parafrankia]OHV40455.1 signal recognition particle-docking protein FtsY [Parafrankia soli]TCJ36406.1 signal recognition particle-docking protein FtsY [Parafrankia sp. BMG5.11]CAI7980385.1 Signal recognition particle receptor FtsY [Frankia sp. Hr75.2]SQD94627.1 Signal recognition particle receptor FtsY [Parafrankia sp. Ea1.12]
MELVILIVVIAVVLVGMVGLVAGTALRSRSRRGGSRDADRPDAGAAPSARSGVATPTIPPTSPQTGAAPPGRSGLPGETADSPAGLVGQGGPAPAGAAGTAGADSVPVTGPEIVAPRAPIEVPAPATGRMVRLRARLARSQNALGRGLLALLSGDNLDEEAWEDVEATLLVADVGVTATAEMVEALRERTRVLGARTAADARLMLRDELLAQVGTTTDRSLRTSAPDRPAVVLVVGVNGTGKTTTCGKIARLLVADGRSVVLGAADTFRAAAADQLETWGGRVGATTVRGAEGADPASVAFEAVKRGIDDGADTVLVDTAGRLHTKVGLMDELTKIKRVVGKQSPVDEVLLVLDSTTGQNALVQARVFTEAVDITGVVLTKLDGTAKGGIVIAVQRELGVPVKLIGLGEGPDDLAPFEPEAFVDALLGEPA